MTDPARSSYSLAWRLALTAVFLRLAYSALVQSYSLLALPGLERMREMYSQPQFLAPLLAHIVAGAVIAGLTTWGAMRRWLARHDATAVDEPRKLYGTFIALFLLYTLAVAAGMAFLQNTLMRFVMDNRDVLQERLGFGMIGQFLTLNIITKLVSIVLEIIGICVIVRIAAWTVQPAGPAGGPAYERRHAAWVTALTVLVWQLTVSISVGSFLQMQAPGASWTEFALGYLVLPAALLALCALVCLKTLPHPIGTARFGRAVAHGTIAFWLAQALGIGIGFLVVRAMTWGQLIRASESHAAAAMTLLAYGALLVLGCLIGRLALYRGAKAATQEG
ncbi:hypothetical protein IPU70_21775 [Achromobacter sp. SD115]|uniref:hypothetical protein n=1 Tax=Achromobacter sp. SD115 TaxID=2782011 RepID=UPI001A965737|nr:hypothetical protein [Achromobacter sp. SD115]MBO1016210.1 hypothetical protein [Achromobacter sp. SD115]